MKYLLDTHTILWHLGNSRQLPEQVKKLIAQEACAVHIVSFWEMSIKISIEKLVLAAPIASVMDEVQRQGIVLLPVSKEAIAYLPQMPFHHRDPFDRLLIAEAIVHDFTILSADSHFDDYRPELLKVW